MSLKEVNTLKATRLAAATSQTRPGIFRPINVYAISNFLTSYLVLHIFFCMKLFAIKLSFGIFVYYLKYFNNIANNTKEICEIYFFCKTNKYIPYAENDYDIYIYIYIYIYIIQQYITCIYIIHRLYYILAKVL